METIQWFIVAIALQMSWREVNQRTRSSQVGLNGDRQSHLEIYAGDTFSRASMHTEYVMYF